MTLLHRIWMVWYRHYDKILSLLFLHRFFLLLLLSLPKWKQIWIYFTCQAQCKRAEINKTMQNDNRENDTRVSKCLSMVLCRHWFDAWQPVRRNWPGKKTSEEKKERQRRMAQVINYFYMSLSLCAGSTISMCRPVCNWNPPLIFLFESWEFTTLFRFYLNLNPFKC